MVLWTIFVLLGPPLVAYLGYYLYARKRRKTKKKSIWKSVMKTLPVSAVISAWVTFVIENQNTLAIPLEDQARLNVVRGLTKFLPFLPPEIALFIILTAIVLLFLSPL